MMSGGRFALAVLLVPVLAVIAAALGYLTAPPGEYGFQEQALVYRELGNWLRMHVLGGALALASGTLQLVLLRSALPRWIHRWTGYVYTVSVLCAGISGLVLAPVAWGGLSNTVAFALLAALWMLATQQAARAGFRGAKASHRLWIARSFALTLAAVTLRAEMMLLLSLGVDFDDAYRIAPWSCWVLNLVAVEWLKLHEAAT
jgi:uncharacterized membrane protein